jgi:hypothetical protein
MANALRLKTPWYRDYEHPDEEEREGVHFESDSAAMVKQLPRYEVFPHFNGLSLPVNTPICTNCRKWTNGSGVGFSARLTHWVDFDSDVNYQPDASPLPSLRAGGSVISGTFGLRGGFATQHFSLKAAVRPGFVSYGHAYVTDPSDFPGAPGVPPELRHGIGPVYPASSMQAVPSSTQATSTFPVGRITHFATALAINGDYAITRNFAIRGVIGNTAVRYLYGYSQPPGIGKPPYVYWLSHEVFMTNENWNYQVGPVLRF